MQRIWTFLQHGGPNHLGLCALQRWYRAPELIAGRKAPYTTKVLARPPARPPAASAARPLRPPAMRACACWSAGLGRVRSSPHTRNLLWSPSTAPRRSPSRPPNPPPACLQIDNLQLQSLLRTPTAAVS